MTQSSDVQGNINKIIIVKVKFILTFTITEFYPVFFMLLLAYFENRKKIYLVVYGLFSALIYLNLWNILRFYDAGGNYHSSNLVKLLSFVMTFTGILFYTGLIVNRQKEKLTESVSEKK